MTEDRARLLVVGDNESNLVGLLDAYDVIVARDGESALDLLTHETPDLILLDTVLPHIDGYEVCTRIKNDPRWRDIPVLFITAQTDETSLVRAFDVGGCDYVTKPFRRRELLARVRLQVDYRRAMQQLRRIAFTDELTGLPNRRAFFKAAAQRFRAARARGTPLAALMLDLDHFKSINDRFGHAVGDEALRRFATCISNCLSEQHLFGRLGGEEFALLAVGADETQANELGESFCRAVNAIDLGSAAPGYSLTVSVGVAHLSEGAADLDALLREADDRLFEAKRDGRNRVRRISRIPGDPHQQS